MAYLTLPRTAPRCRPSPPEEIYKGKEKNNSDKKPTSAGQRLNRSRIPREKEDTHSNEGDELLTRVLIGAVERQ